MSFGFFSLQPPNTINDCDYDVSCNNLIMIRGNEIIIQNIGGMKPDKIESIKVFGFIDKICRIILSESIIYAFLVNNEMIVLYDFSKRTCIQKGTISNTIGRYVSQQIMVSAKNSFIVHNRNRSISVFLLNEKGIHNQFTAFLPYKEIFSIVGTKKSDVYYFLALDFQDVVVISEIGLSDNEVSIVSTTEIESSSTTPCFCMTNEDEFYVGINSKIVIVKGFSISKEYLTNISLIHNILLIDDSHAFVSDKFGKIYNVLFKGLPKMERLLIETTSSSPRIINLDNNFYFCHSCGDDSHILKYSSGQLSYWDSFLSLSNTIFMNRNHLIHNSGKMKTISNGSPTIVSMDIPFIGGMRIWKIRENLVVSSFNQTFCIDMNLMKKSNELIHEEETSILVSLIEGVGIVQVTIFSVFINGSEVVKMPNISHACTKNSFLFITTDKDVYKYALSPEFEFKNRRSFENQISSFSINGDRCSIGFWNSSSVIISNHNFEINDTFEIPKFHVVISLLYNNDELLLSTSHGLYLYSEHLLKLLDSSQNNGHLRSVDGKPFLCSATPCFIEDGKMRYICCSPCIDAVEFGSQTILILTDHSVQSVIIESNYHSSIIEHYQGSFDILFSTTSDSNTCSAIYVAKNNDFYYLMSNLIKPCQLKSGEIPKCIIWITINEEYFLLLGCSVHKKGVLVLFTSDLYRITEFAMTDEPNCMVFVDKTWVAVSHSNFISIYEISKSQNGFVFQIKSKIQARTQCSSLTSPNSCYLVYSDSFSSIVLYIIIEGEITEVARDYNPKSLKYATAISNNQFFAVSKTGNAFLLKLENGQLKTQSAYNLGSLIETVMASPPITLMCRNGSIVFLQKCGEEELQLYRIMKGICYDIFGNRCDDWRSVRSNGKEYETGEFFDGDLLVSFLGLSNDIQEKISKCTTLPKDQIIHIISNLSNKVANTRFEIQQIEL